MALTARALLERYPDQSLRTYELAAAAIVFRSSAVGLTPNGYAKAFVVCDKFLGLGDGDVDNSAGAAGAKSVQLYVEGDFALTIAGVTRTNIGDAVSASAVLAAFVNLEKTSNDTLGKIRVDRLRVAGGRS